MARIFNPIQAPISTFPTGNPPTGDVFLWRTADGWVERRPDGVARSLIYSGITVHNFGVATSTALQGTIHNGAEVHVEGGGNYTIAAGDWSDGQWFRITHTAGAATTERLIPSGFQGQFLRNGNSTAIAVAGLSIGKRDGVYVATVTQNGGNKFLNIFDNSFVPIDTTFSLTSGSGAPISHSAIATYLLNQQILARMTPGTNVGTRNLVGISGNSNAQASATGTAIAANAYVHDHSAATTPFFTDGYVIDATWIPTGAVVGQTLWLGTAGAIALAPPPIVSGNIIQEIGFVRQGGQGVIRFGTPYTVQL
jgi:hypothetical protein